MKINQENVPVVQKKSDLTSPSHENTGKSATPPQFGLTTSSSPFQLTSESEACMENTQAGAEPSKWDTFAELFNEEFHDALHTFEPDSAEKAGKSDGLTGAQLSCFFTEKQRKSLTHYMTSPNKEIPDRLFNDEDPGKATISQRLMISAHILANGTYSPGSFSQKVHARMCFHWLHITHHYAGATTTGLSKNIMGNTDHAGNIVLGTGKVETVFKEGARIKQGDLPSDESGKAGPIYEGTGHAETAKKKPDDVWRNEEMGIERFGDIQPGDWLYYYNGNKSKSGNHSVLFSHWATKIKTDEATGIQYREAKVYSQPSPEKGGRLHDVTLGDGFKPDGPKIRPITRVTRVEEGARAADTIEKIIPKKDKKKEGYLINRNSRYIDQFEKKNGKLDRGKMMEFLKKECLDHLTVLQSRLTLDQFILLHDTAYTTDLEMLIRLTQKLRTLRKNIDILNKNTRDTYEGKEPKEGKKAKPGKDEQHEGVLEDFEEEERIAEEKIAELEAQMEPFEELIEAEEDKLAEFADPSNALNSARIKMAQIRREKNAFGGRPRKGTPRREEFDKLKAERAVLLDQIGYLAAEQKAYRKGTKSITRAIAALRKKTRPFQQKIDKIEKARRKAAGKLPFGMVHPGYIKGGDKSSPDGELKSIFTFTQLQDFLAEEKL